MVLYRSPRWASGASPSIRRCWLAVNPLYGLRYLFSHGYASFLVLGAVFLCVTGAEALYADMGHFGARPIRLAWSAIVFPSLVLNYAGQAAIVLAGASTSDNIFFRLCPQTLLLPLVVLATLATIIASQSIITGAFSMTRQAIQLGWLPRLRIMQTSEVGYGQIYVGAINWLLMVVTVGLALSFGKSDNLAAAYGIAVSLTMLMTSALLFMAMREIWGWSLWTSAALAGALFCVDGALLCGQSGEGGRRWLRAAAARRRHLWSDVGLASRIDRRDAGGEPEADPGRRIHGRRQGQARAAGARDRGFHLPHYQDTPPVMRWHVQKNRALHQKLFVLKVITESVPWIEEQQRLAGRRTGTGFLARDRALWLHGAARYSAAAATDTRRSAVRCSSMTSPITSVMKPSCGPRTARALWAFEEKLYAAMARNATHVSDFLRLPSDGVVEIGRQIRDLKAYRPSSLNPG